MTVSDMGSIVRRPFKRLGISDQQKRRDLTLLRQEQSRRDAQQQARRLVSTALLSDLNITEHKHEHDLDLEWNTEAEVESEDFQCPTNNLDVRQASRLRGTEARKWFSRQLMLPEWMIDIPDNLTHDWYVFARPSGKRCIVVSCNGSTVSRLRNGSILHYFPSALPNGARRKDTSGSSQSYCILDCIFHEPDQTYYVIDMVCWKGFSLYNCTAEFRFFWLNSKLQEMGAHDLPSHYHRYRFNAVPVYNCGRDGLFSAYKATTPYVKDGLLFYNKHAHYQTGNTPLALAWKDRHCSQYVIDTDREGHIPPHQKVVLELKADGALVTSDDPPISVGHLDSKILQESRLCQGDLVNLYIVDEVLRFVEGKLEKVNLQFAGKAHRAKAFADPYSKIVFQYMARCCPLEFAMLVSACSSDSQINEVNDIEMTG